MIALDLDGTLLDYSPEGPSPKINHALLARLAVQGVREVAILTNQGGLCFGVLGYTRRDGRRYPDPAQFCLRLRCAITAMSRYGIAVVAVRVSCWHNAAREQPAVATTVQAAAREIRADLSGLPWLDWRVYTTARARKPQPLMLRSVGATCYYGDSLEDEQAAANAGIPFVKVERFL